MVSAAQVVWGQAIHAVFTVTVRGSLSIGGGQYKNTEEYMLLDDGWAVYKWPRLRWGPFNTNSAVQRHRLNRETWFKATDPTDDLDGPERACGGGATPSERVACVQEYREIQQTFWSKYARLVPSMPRVWNLCTAFGHGVGADYMRCTRHTHAHVGTQTHTHIHAHTHRAHADMNTYIHKRTYTHVGTRTHRAHTRTHIKHRLTDR